MTGPFDYNKYKDIAKEMAISYALLGKITGEETPLYQEFIRFITCMNAWHLSPGDKFDSVENVIYNSMTDPLYARTIKNLYEVGIRNYLGL